MPKPKTQAQKPKAKKAKGDNPKPRRIRKIPGRKPAMTQMARPMQSLAKKLSDPITLGLSLPHLFPTPRFSDQFTAGATAIANPFAVESRNWSEPNTIYNAIPKGSYYAATSRSVLSNLVEWNNLPSDESVYDFYFPANPLVPVSGGNFEKSMYISCPAILAADNDTAVDLNPHYATSRYWAAPGYNSIHGYTYYNVDANARKGTWIEAGENTTVTFGTAFAMSVVNVTARASSVRPYKWNGDTWTPMQSTIAFDPGTLNSTTVWPCYSSGYYAFEVVTQVTASAVLTTLNYRISMVLKHIGSGFGFRPMPHVEEMALNIDGIRPSAVSIMLSPHPSVLNLGGEVAGVQLPPNEQWNSIFEGTGVSPIDTIANLNGSYTGKLKDGIYGFLKPTSTDDFAMTEPFILLDDEISGYRNPLQPAGGWMVIAANVPATAPNVYAGALAYLTLAHGVEYRTTNVWLSVLAPKSTPQVFADAIYALRDVEQWHENPWHIKDIFKSVMSAGKTALKIAPTVAELISAFIPGVAPSKAVLASLSALGHAL